MREDFSSLEQSTFTEIARLIQSSRTRALQAVNQDLIELYWEVGRIISGKIENAEWGAAVVDRLADFLKRTEPGLKGFTQSNLFMMRQFYDAYRDHRIVHALRGQFSWTHHRLILAQSKRPEEREFYLQMAIREQWSSRELERQFRLGRFEQTMLRPVNAAPIVKQLHSRAEQIFKDSYVVEFVNLPEDHSEADLHRGILVNLRKFLCELGRDSCFIGSEHPIQVRK